MERKIKNLHGRIVKLSKKRSKIAAIKREKLQHELDCAMQELIVEIMRAKAEIVAEEGENGR